MVASLSALNALAIDIMLPALPDIGADFALTNDNDRQLVIVSYVALFGVAQLIYGPLADAYGRRSVLLCALVIFIAGSALCVVAPNFELVLAARALQGVGAAATRVIAIAVVRDLTEGRRMAQIMSMAMTVFMIIPIIAPGSIGRAASPCRSRATRRIRQAASAVGSSRCPSPSMPAGSTPDPASR
jgi:DHA1 family bicyclomycin/chloramphenicol resistance-like MFS transporter